MPIMPLGPCPLFMKVISMNISGHIAFEIPGCYLITVTIGEFLQYFCCNLLSRPQITQAISEIELVDK
jgi:hypothetical protein